MKFNSKLLLLASIAVLIPATAQAETGTYTQVAPAAGSSFDFGDASIQAKPGECYGKVSIPAVTKTETKQVEVKGASKTIARIVPATYSTATEQVLVREASEKLVVIPATYKTVTETITVKPQSTRVVKVPAKYEMVREQILVSPARTEWKQGESSSITKVNDRGEVMCLVEVPAQYRTIEKRVQTTPETTREEVIAAVTKTITKQVIDQPSRVEKKVIPAQYKTVSKKVLDTPEQVQYQETPAKYKTVSYQTVVSPEKVKWDKILCQTNANATNVTAVQKALQKAGFNPGQIDGVLGHDTYKAIDSFQRAKGLSRGEITYETLSALGLSI